MCDAIDTPCLLESGACFLGCENKSTVDLVQWDIEEIIEEEEDEL